MVHRAVGDSAASGLVGGHHASQASAATPIVTVDRDALIRARQAELKKVVERHDELVREAFHLEKFVTLLHYDPKAAKEDSSAVFQQFKAKYDLMSHSPTPGPSRKTRRAVNERLESLKAPPQSISNPSSPVALKKDKSQTRSSVSQEHAAMSSSSSFIWPRGGHSSSRLSDLKGKHKESAWEHIGMPNSEAAESISTFKGKHQVQSKGSRRSVSHFQNSDECSEAFSSILDSMPPPSSHPKKRPRTSLLPDGSTRGSSTISHADVHIESDVQHRKKHLPTKFYGQPIPGRPRRTGTVDPTHTLADIERPTVAGKTIAGKTVMSPPTTRGVKHKAEGDPDAWKPRIKRVRLLVKRPPPFISHPAQRPAPAQFGRSLSAFISSYIMIDGVDYDESTLRARARQEGDLHNRIQLLKSQGRLLLDAQSALNMLGINDLPTRQSHAAITGAREVGNPNDTWSYIVQSIVTRPRSSKSSIGSYIAGQVANKIKVYWDGMAMKEERVRAAEEKRLRALAKATMKLVTTEWKKAVFHIREQERLKVEAEEKRIGRQHLDAILNQSGQILEAQHWDLLRELPRSRSASGSVSTALEDWVSASGVDSDDEEVDDSDPENVEDHLDPDIEPDLGNSDTPVQSDSEVEPDTVSAHSGVEIGDSDDESDVTDGHTDGPDDIDNQPRIYVDRSEEPSSIISAGVSDVDMDSEARAQIVDLQNEHSILEDDVSTHSRETMPEDHAGTPETSSSAAPTPLYTPATVADTPPVEDDCSRSASVTDQCEPLSSWVDLKTPPNAFTPNGDGLVATEHHLGIPFGPHSIDHLDDSTVPEAPSIRSSPQNLDCTNDGNSSTTNVPTVGAKPGEVQVLADNVILDIPIEDSKHGDPALQDQRYFFHRKEEEEEYVEEQQKTEVEGVVREEAVTVEDPDKSSTMLDKVESPKDVDAEPIPEEPEWEPPHYLEPYAVTRVDWDAESKVKPPLLLRGSLRPYQQSGLEWLASLHTNKLNGILADEMGLGKTIQTIALLAHLACDRGIWGPHLIIVPTSVLLNWIMEFKKFLPGFNILSYHGSTKRRKELRQGWNNRHAFNVCVTSYTLASRDAHIFKRKAWYYMILDEAHMIKNFKSQRWNILLMFRSFRRLLLTGTPLQNNLTELWALLQFLMSGTNFANLKEFGEWFSNPLEKAIEQGTVMDEETQHRVTKLHTVLRPYLLRRLKRDVEKELPSKYEHLVFCRLSKRQRFLYDEFMSRAETREDLKSGVYQKVANILMQLRKVCNHPDLFEVRPIVTSFAMDRSAIADFEIKELLVRRQLFVAEEQEARINLNILGLEFTSNSNKPLIAALETRHLDASDLPQFIPEHPGDPPPYDTCTIAGYRRYTVFKEKAAIFERRTHMAYLNRLRCKQLPVFGKEMIDLLKRLYIPLVPLSGENIGKTAHYDGKQLATPTVKSYVGRAAEMAGIVDRFAFATPAVIARDMPRIALAEIPDDIVARCSDMAFDAVLHRSSVKLQIAFPDASLLQYDCGKLQELARLLRERKEGGHRVLIFTQMTKILDILEAFLNFHGYLYLRLDGATKIEDRQYITERFNADSRVFAFIASSRSGGVGINLTGADTVVFYDSDFNPQMDRQCEDRAHRIGQIRDVHIYRFVSQFTVEEAMLRKANQKRSLDDLVIQQGEFDWRGLLGADDREGGGLALSALEKALGEVEDVEDAHAARVATTEAAALEGVDNADFADADAPGDLSMETSTHEGIEDVEIDGAETGERDGEGDPAEDEDEGGSTVDYMLTVVRHDIEFFREWRL